MSNKHVMLSNVPSTERLHRKKDGTLHKHQIYSIDQIYYNTCPSVCGYFADFLHRMSGKTEEECNQLIRLLRSSENAVIAGSFIMSFWNDYKENDRQFTPNDMDIFCQGEETKLFLENSLGLDFESVSNEYEYAPFCVFSAEFGSLKIQLVSHEYYRDIANVCKEFDIDICKMWFDGKKMYSYVPFDKKDLIATPNPVKSQVAITLSRVAKYVTRGYGIEKLNVNYLAKEYKPAKAIKPIAKAIEPVKVIKPIDKPAKIKVVKAANLNVKPTELEAKSDSDESSTLEGQPKKVNHKKVTKFLEQVKKEESSAVKIPKITHSCNELDDAPVIIPSGKMTFDELETSDTE